MSCCGKKRQEITSSYSGAGRARSQRLVEEPIVSLAPQRSRVAATFRYTGSSYLEVEGIFRHRLYRFSKATPEVVIMAEDVTVMRAYPELIELKRSHSDD